MFIKPVFELALYFYSYYNLYQWCGNALQPCFQYFVHCQFNKKFRRVTLNSNLELLHSTRSFFKSFIYLCVLLFIQFCLFSQSPFVFPFNFLSIYFSSYTLFSLFLSVLFSYSLYLQITNISLYLSLLFLSLSLSTLLATV